VPYLGYDAQISARALETIVPISTAPNRPTSAGKAQALHDLQANGGVLVSRFFAPKIVNYAVSQPPFTPGWRKLVYLPARTGSVAYNNKVSGGYILFNYFQPDTTKSPFGDANAHAVSSNNQVILVPNFEDTSKPYVTYQKGEVDTSYFAVYAGNNTSYNIINTLTAGFDIPTNGELQEYAVPDACAHCHGQDGGKGGVPTRNSQGKQVFADVKPNYLDSDQWYDAARLDFPNVLASSYDPVFDGGKDHSSAQYQEAVATIARINLQIRKDGQKVPSSTRATDAVDLWLANHNARNGAGNVQAAPVPIYKRGLPNSDPKYRWDISDPYQVEAMDQLSQSCFRCHSSIKYNVFDKQAVVLGKMAGYVSDDYMPLGRTLSGGEQGQLACLRALLRHVDGSGGTTPENACNFGPEFVEPYGGGQYNRFRVRNLKLGISDSTTTATAGQPIKASLDINHDCPACGGAGNDVFAGFAAAPRAWGWSWSGEPSS